MKLRVRRRTDNVGCGQQWRDLRTAYTTQTESVQSVQLCCGFPMLNREQSHEVSSQHQMSAFLPPKMPVDRQKCQRLQSVQESLLSSQQFCPQHLTTGLCTSGTNRLARGPLVESTVPSGKVTDWRLLSRRWKRVRWTLAVMMFPWRWDSTQNNQLGRNQPQL